MKINKKANHSGQIRMFRSHWIMVVSIVLGLMVTVSGCKSSKAVPVSDSQPEISRDIVRNSNPPDVTLTIPGSFSPNGDGKNDFWHIEGLDAYDQFEIQVFNRWGEVIFMGGNDWDGANKKIGGIVPSGAYVYSIHFPNFPDHDRKGTLTVIR